MKMFTLLSLPIIIFTTATMAFAAEAPSQESDLCYALSHGSVKEYLSDQDLASLARTCRGTASAVAEELIRRRHLAWLLKNTIDVDCSKQRMQFANNEDFQQYVLNTIVNANKRNPERWIKLNLESNNLGNDIQFLQNLMNKITDLIYKLHIDIAELRLYDNQLKTLPDNIFNKLPNLQNLWLNQNLLTNLPVNIFNNLRNLESLGLGLNQLKVLPENIFNNLRNLKNLVLDHNLLNALPVNIFNNLRSLEYLALKFNQLNTLPADIFNNLRNLRELWLFHNGLTPKTNEDLHLPPTCKVYW